MTDKECAKQLTDKEIEEALEHCSKRIGCGGCPTNPVDCAHNGVLEKQTLNYIDRLKIVIQGLKEENIHLYNFKVELQQECINRGWAEYEHGDFRILSDEEKDKIRKKTAKEISENLLCFENLQSGEVYIDASYLKRLAKKYGVEVEE